MAACQTNNEPENLVPRKQFIEMLVDVQLTDAVLTNLQYYDKKFTDSTMSYYNWIYIKHEVNEAKFDSTITYYSDNPAKFDKILTEVMIRLQKRESESITDSTAMKNEKAKVLK